jgi:cell division inhibitor SulA
MTPEQVIVAAMEALGRGRSQIVTGWKNKLYAFAAAKISKPLAARVGAKFLARFRLAKVQR